MLVVTSPAGTRRSSPTSSAPSPPATSERRDPRGRHRLLYAAADTRDGDHRASRDLLETHAANDLVVPGPVITETAWLIATRLGAAAETAFVASVAAVELRSTDLTSADYRRCAELLAAYEDLELGLVDASVVAIAERLGLTTIATLNHRDFRVVRPTHVESFELVPQRSGR